MNNPDARCSPLCGASNAYGKWVRWWNHEPLCPMRAERDDDEGLASPAVRIDLR